MEIDYNKYLEELIKRSQENNECIMAIKEKKACRDVTQTINSMYLMLVVPEEILGIKQQWDLTKEEVKNSLLSAREDDLKSCKYYHNVNNLINGLVDANRLKYNTDKLVREQSESGQRKKQTTS